MFEQLRGESRASARGELSYALRAVTARLADEQSEEAHGEFPINFGSGRPEAVRSFSALALVAAASSSHLVTTLW